MNRWINRFKRWTLKLPARCSSGHSEIHSSLLFTLALLACVLFSLGLYRESFLEFRTVAITLPLVWLGSLSVRLAAQQLAAGGYASDTETLVGPTGNLRTDYEFWPSKVIWAYSVAGQCASLGLVSIALVVNVAVAELGSEGVAMAQLLGFEGGWSSRAWATQIFWVNAFLFCLHLLPTIPFDMRASVFALFGWKARNAQEPFVFRRIGLFDSHLAAIMLGVCVTCASLGWYFQSDLLVWCIAGAASIYLFVASRWEHSRARELEAQYAPGVPMEGSVRHAVRQVGARLRRVSEEIEEPADLLVADDETVRAEEDFEDEELEQAMDLDEILRKVHRDGVDSLSDQEQDALLSASRQLKARRDS